MSRTSFLVQSALLNSLALSPFFFFFFFLPHGTACRILVSRPVTKPLTLSSESGES